MATTAVFVEVLMMIANETIIQTSQSGMNSYNNYLLDLGVEPSEEKCFGSYGCFDLKAPWTSDQRPVSAFPESLDKVEPMFAFYNKNHPDTPIYLEVDKEISEPVDMDINLPLYLVIHGFTDNGKKSWVLQMKDELLKRNPESNVILVDWGRASSPPYPQAVANIRLAGKITAHFLENMYGNENHHYDRMHCIGHSLGAHMCGYIGYELQKIFNCTLGRITGMDPAEPHFSKTQPPVRLDRTAAKYVDIIHTDAGGFAMGAFGIVQRIGHVDFFPNGGYNQPGCTQSFSEVASENGFFQGVKKFIGCNHIRSYELFIDSINRKCPFLTISCSSYKDFKEGKCFRCDKHGNRCITFGMDSKRSYHHHLANKMLNSQDNNIQYLMTTDRDPFCKSHYKITVHISSHEESKVHKGEIGTLWYAMHTTTDGSGQKSNKFGLPKESYHEPGAVYTHVIPGDGVPTIKAVEVEWQYQTNFINPLTWRLMSTPRIYVDKVEVEALETGDSIFVCPKNKKPLRNSSPQLMLRSYCKE